MNTLFRVTFLCAVLVFQFPTFLSAGPVPDTGQTKCYNNSGEIPCPQPGEAFYGQDAQYTINPPSYTKLDANGDDLADDSISWVMVRDNVTGLIWESKTNDGSIHDKTNTYSLHDSESVFIEALNTNNFGGYSDWRLPTCKELNTILDHSRKNPGINTAYFPHTNSDYHWSSTSVPRYMSDNNYAVGFGQYLVSYGGFSKETTMPVRAVRGNQIELLGSMIYNGDTTLTDTSTGLMWEQKSSTGGINDKDDTYAWEEALSYISNLNNSMYLGYNDWRLPSVNELLHIVDYTQAPDDFITPPIAYNPEYFPNTKDWFYWTSTIGGSSSTATSVNFAEGGITGSDSKTLNYFYARAVRGGQNQTAGHIVIHSPVQGGRMDIGSTQTISWDTAGILGDVSILLSREGGKSGTFETISDSTTNDGSFVWAVTGQESVNCALKIVPLSSPEKTTTQYLFSISNLHNAWINVERLNNTGMYKLTLSGRYTDSVVPLEVDWAISDPTISAVSGDILTPLLNGWIDISATYEGYTYSKSLPIYTTFEAMEMENNNTKDASNVSNMPMVDGTFYRGSFPSGDVDYFKFTLAADSILDLGYLSYSTTADMNVEIFDNNDTLMASGVSTNGGPLVHSLGLPAGTYYLRLTSAGDTDQDNYYVVTYKILDNLSAQSTTPLIIGQTINGALYHLQDEVDFTFVLTQADTVNLKFKPQSSFAGYLIEVLDSTQTVINQIECREQIPVNIETQLIAGTYTVRVTPLDSVDASSPFILELSESLNQVESESNDTYKQSTIFDTSQPMLGRLTDNSDIDFFEFTLSTPRFVELTFTCPNSSKDFYMTLYKESDQNLIDGINAIGGADISLHMGLGIGRYYLKVTSDGVNADTVNQYQLAINDSTQTNLEIESNNTLKFANAIEKTGPRNGRIFSTGDSDYYGFHLSTLGLFNIAFSTTSSTGDYTISLVDENDQSIDFRDSFDGASCNMDGYQAPGNYYIKIENNGDVDQHSQYELTLTSGLAIEGIKKLVSVSVTGAQNDMLVNDTQSLAAAAGYSDATSENIASPIWSSLNTSVATVDASGLITAVSEGTTTIVATYGGLTGQFAVTVGAPAQTVSQHYGNLIIVAGSGANYSDSLAASAQYLADLVYRNFQTRLFDDDDIYYFNPEPFHDIDGDGLDNGIVDDTSPTVGEFGQVITGWAADQNTDGPLYIYLVGHGEIDGFYFPTETLQASQLDGFIDSFQSATARQVVVVIEACKSGSFTDDLVSAGQDRVVVTSTDDQDAYLQYDGRVSFSQFFMNKLLGGDSFHESWLAAKSKLAELELPFSRMQPQLAEGILAAGNNTWLGGNFVIASVQPGWVIGQVIDAATGFSIQNATVDVGGIITSPTVENGCYLAQVPVGTYAITVTADGYNSITLPAMGVTIGDSVIQNFNLTPLGDITYGDVTGNGLNLDDAIIALQCLAGLDVSEQIRPDYATSGQDVSGDSAVGMEEVIYILQKVSGSR